jgi:hypothetical protein
MRSPRSESKENGDQFSLFAQNLLNKRGDRLIDQRCALLSCYKKTFCGVIRTFI